MRLAMLPKPLSLSYLSLSLSDELSHASRGKSISNRTSAVHAQLCLRQRTLRNRALSSTHRASSSKCMSA